MTTGALVLVGTPIGNLGDLSPRAVEALCAADVIACEDTRHTRKLLSHAGISATGLVSVHEHNERAKAGSLVKRMLGGERIALVSDAGMPGVSDPGERLVAAAIEAGIPVEVVPGPSAVVTALVVSGMPTGRFCFEGFLPRKGRERRARLDEIAVDARTTVLYEAPTRVAATLSDLAALCGPDRRVALARELTKKFEEVWRGTLSAAIDQVANVPPRGEYVIVVEGANRPEASADDIDAALRAGLDAGRDRKTLVAEVAADLRVPKRQVYEASLRL